MIYLNAVKKSLKKTLPKKFRKFHFETIRGLNVICFPAKAQFLVFKGKKWVFKNELES
jgi:hypothetical protein